MRGSEDNMIADHGGVYPGTSISQDSEKSDSKLSDPAGSGAISIRAVGRQSHDTDKNAICSLIAHSTTGQDTRVGTVSNKRSSILVPAAANFNVNGMEADKHGGTHEIAVNPVGATGHNKETVAADQQIAESYRRYSHANADSMQPSSMTSPSSALADLDPRDSGNSAVINANARSDNAVTELGSDIRMAYMSSVNTSTAATNSQLHSKVDRYGFMYSNDNSNDDYETFATNATQTPA
jgi:hypothetical protein